MFNINANPEFFSIMSNLLEENGIYNVNAPKATTKATTKANYKSILSSLESQKCETEIDGISSLFFKYFDEQIRSYDLGSDLSIPMPANTVIFKSINREREYLYSLQKNDDFSYILKAKTYRSLNEMKNKLCGVFGMLAMFETKTKELINSYFNTNKLSFRNHYLSMANGINQLASQIDKEREESLNILPYNKKAKKLIFDLLETGTEGNDDKNFNYATYIIMVFSFIEHMGMLTLPFWYYMQHLNDNWRNFCHNIDYSLGFDTYRDFYTSKIDWIGSFIEILCDNKKYNNQHYNTYDETTQKQNTLRRIYKKLRYDFRNPLHHGISTGTEMTGLSLEVPSLKNKVNAHTAPLMKNIDYAAFAETRKFYNLFIELLEKHNPQIFKYIETGWNVPVNCSELVSYIQENDIETFIERYENLLGHIG